MENQDNLEAGGAMEIRYSDEQMEYFRQQGAKGGQKASKGMTKEARKERARKAVGTRLAIAALKSLAKAKQKKSKAKAKPVVAAPQQDDDMVVAKKARPKYKRWGQPYVDQGAAAYENRYRQRRITSLMAKAKELATS